MIFFLHDSFNFTEPSLHHTNGFFIFFHFIIIIIIVIITNFFPLLQETAHRG